MLDVRRRFPNSGSWQTGLAHIAERRGDYAEAVRRWRAVLTSGTPDIEPHIRLGTCLRTLGRIKEADATFDEAVRLDPHNIRVAIERAYVSEAGGDWPEAIARWRSLSERVKVGATFAGQARALTELGRLDEAEAILRQGLTFYSSDLEIGTARAHLAERRGDLTVACERWAELRRIGPYLQTGYHGGAKCLFKAERHVEADAVMREAIERFPDEKWPLGDFADFAQRRGDWHEAAARWEAFRSRFPDKEEGYRSGIHALNAAGRHEEAAALQRRTPPS